jgi:hypothetical protein
MISRDYTKEVGIPSHKKTLPRPIAFIVLALVAVGVSYGVAGVLSEAKEHEAKEKPAAAAPAAPTAEAAPAK